MSTVSRPAPLDDTAKELTVQSVAEMNYVEFISLLRETNRCPGGKQTVRYIAQNAFVHSNTRVLEIGSNTGFTSLELARITGCHVHGIDPEIAAVRQAQRELKADTSRIRERVSFSVGDAYNLAAENNSVDLVVAGGATSFMSDKPRAVTEYWRVLRPRGFLSVTNLYYRKTPPERVLRDVGAIIGTRIEPWNEEQWVSLFLENNGFEMYVSQTRDFTASSDGKVDDYVEWFMQKPHLKLSNPEVRKAIERRWKQTLKTFNENHRYLSFVTALFRKRLSAEEPELFVAQGW